MNKLDKKLVHKLETHLDPKESKREIAEADKESNVIYKYILEVLK